MGAETPTIGLIQNLTRQQQQSQLTFLRQNPSDANLRHTNASLVRNFFDTFGWHK
jgi:hypothetical protein